MLSHRAGDSTSQQANSRGQNRLRSNEQTRLTLDSVFLHAASSPQVIGGGGATRMLRIAWGPSALGAPSADPGPSPPAPPRARARPASYARLSLPHNLAVVGAAPGRRAPAANQSRTSNGHEAKAACARGLLLRPTTMRSDVTRSLRATSSLHLPHLVDHLAVSALARRALR